MLRRACEENSITTEGMSRLSENIGSCPKCHKALMSAEPKVFTVVSSLKSIKNAWLSCNFAYYHPSNPSKMLHFCVILLTVIPQILQNASFSCNFAHYHPSNPSKMLDFRVILLTIIPALGGMNWKETSGAWEGTAQWERIRDALV